MSVLRLHRADNVIELAVIVTSSPSYGVQIVAGRYELIRELGRGGMGRVFLALDRHHDRHVALKCMRDDAAVGLARERFLREIRLASQLNHPHILAVHDSFEADGQLYYVTPYIAGETLAARLTREHQLSIDEAVHIGLQLLAALHYAHERGILHRDIKPENVLLHEGVALLADFGLARAISTDGRVTQSGVAVGTPAYMSPEQAVGAPDIDGRSDLYAVACVLYEMLTGDPPFTGASLQAILARKATDAVLPIRTVRPTVSHALEAAVGHALARNPADRYATAREFAGALQTAGRQGPGGRRRFLLGVAAGALLAAGFAARPLWVHLHAPPRPQVTSLAVLPFENLSSDSSAYFAEQVHEALIGALGRIPALRVTSRQSTLRYRGPSSSLGEIAAALNVDAVVEGSVVQVRDSVRIYARLVVAQPERQIWAHHYERLLSGIFALQDDVTRDIARQIAVQLPQARDARPRTEHAVRPDAYRAWLRGMDHMNRLRGMDVNACLRSALDAVRIDPTFARAHVLLARCYGQQPFVLDSPPAGPLTRAKESAYQALRLDNDLDEAHAALAWSLAVLDWDWNGAERYYRRALELNPGSSRMHATLGWMLSWQGRFDEALVHARRALDLDPLSLGINQNLAAILTVAGRHDEAISQARRVIQLDSAYVFGHVRLTIALLAAGRADEAVRAAHHALALNDHRESHYKSYLASAYSAAGRDDQARAILNELLTTRSHRYVPADAIAGVYASLGETDNALRWLEIGMKQRDANMILLKVWPIWRPLRSEPRYRGMLRRIGLPD